MIGQVSQRVNKEGLLDVSDPTDINAFTVSAKPSTQTF